LEYVRPFRCERILSTSFSCSFSLYLYIRHKKSLSFIFGLHPATEKIFGIDIENLPTLPIFNIFGFFYKNLSGWHIFPPGLSFSKTNLFMVNIHMITITSYFVF